MDRVNYRLFAAGMRHCVIDPTPTRAPKSSRSCSSSSAETGSSTSTRRSGAPRRPRSTRLPESPIDGLLRCERMTGIEPALSAWEAKHG
jgi:hypothetical protein